MSMESVVVHTICKYPWRGTCAKIVEYILAPLQKTQHLPPLSDQTPGTCHNMSSLDKENVMSYKWDVRSENMFCGF